MKNTDVLLKSALDLFQNLDKTARGLVIDFMKSLLKDGSATEPDTKPETDKT